MSTLIFFASIALLTFALACATDWVIASADPSKTLRKPINPVRVAARKYRKVVPAKRHTGKIKHQAEMRELPFLC